jgi:hypothetical protein
LQFRFYFFTTVKILSLILEIALMAILFTRNIIAKAKRTTWCCGMAKEKKKARLILVRQITDRYTIYWMLTVLSTFSQFYLGG